MCDTLAVRVADGVLFAKNSDRHPREAQVVEAHPRRAGTGSLSTQYLTIPDAPASAFVGSRPTWLWGVEHGINEHGVAIGNEKIWTVDRPRHRPPALLGMDLVRLGLERGRSADAAVDVMTELLERYGQGGSGEPHADEPYFSSFLVADARGGWIIETSDRTWAARPIGAGAAISNRVSLTTDWTRASANVAAGTDFDTFRLADMPTGVADHRLAVTRAAVARRTHTTVADLAAVLRDHGAHARADGGPPPTADLDGSGFSVCMHRPELHAQTTASLIAQLGDGPLRIWTALGNPCVSVYVPGFPPAVAPELADAVEWQRFARLRDEVEAEAIDYLAVRAALAAVEQELHAAADDAYASGARGNLEAWTATAYAPVAAVLDRLGV